MKLETMQRRIRELEREVRSLSAELATTVALIDGLVLAKDEQGV